MRTRKLLSANMANYSYRLLIHDVHWCFTWFQGQPGSGEAAFDEAGPVVDLLQAVPDDLDQVAEAGDGEVGQHAAFKHRPDPLHRIQVRRISGQPEHPQPRLGIGEG